MLKALAITIAISELKSYINHYDTIRNYIIIHDNCCIYEKRIIDFDFDSDNQKIENDSQYNFIVISLGCNCEVALNLRRYNLRIYAFPLDWCITPYNALFNLINNKFKDFFKKENLVNSSNQYFSPNLKNFFNRLHYINTEHSTWVLDKKFEMIFVHDFPDNKPTTIYQNYKLQYDKYIRRIERFYSEINSGKHVYFVRFFDITKSQAIALHDLLKKKFPRVPFTLIVIGNDPQEFNENWNISNLKNYTIKPEPFWKILCENIVAGIL